MLEREGDYRTGKRYKMVVNGYDICDWIYFLKYFPKPEDDKWYRRGKRK
jgi:hypothetical protein